MKNKNSVQPWNATPAITPPGGLSNDTPPIIRIPPAGSAITQSESQASPWHAWAIAFSMLAFVSALTGVAMYLIATAALGLPRVGGIVVALVAGVLTIYFSHENILDSVNGDRPVIAGVRADENVRIRGIEAQERAIKKHYNTAKEIELARIQQQADAKRIIELDGRLARLEARQDAPRLPEPASEQTSTFVEPIASNSGGWEDPRTMGSVTHEAIKWAHTLYLPSGQPSKRCVTDDGFIRVGVIGKSGDDDPHKQALMYYDIVRKWKHGNGYALNLETYPTSDCLPH